MQVRPIVFFDSGIGGLSVLRVARIKMPCQQFIYIADDAAFPYGNWDEESLKYHILNLFKSIIERFNPSLVVLACNTASTLVLEQLRVNFPKHIFVGTVPAIKKASLNTRSGLISVLATPSTVKRAYTHELIELHAQNCEVNLVGAKHLAMISEKYLRGGNIDAELLAKEILPCFISKNNKQTDIVVLGCTHYPFLINQMRNIAPWPVDWYDPAEAVVSYAKSLLPEVEPTMLEDFAYFTSNNLDIYSQRLLKAFVLKYAKF